MCEVHKTNYELNGKNPMYNIKDMYEKILIIDEKLKQINKRSKNLTNKIN